MKVYVNAELTSGKSSFVSGYGPREVTLASGENKIELKVKSLNESIKTYTVTIVKSVSKQNSIGDLLLLKIQERNY